METDWEENQQKVPLAFEPFRWTKFLSLEPSNSFFDRSLIETHTVYVCLIIFTH